MSAMFSDISKYCTVKGVIFIYITLYHVYIKYACNSIVILTCKHSNPFLQKNILQCCCSKNYIETNYRKSQLCNYVYRIGYVLLQLSET